MVYSKERRPRRGQEFRDRVRCEALDTKFMVHTMDDKHDAAGAAADRHCTANFADTHRMLKAMDCTWGPDMNFDIIVLDYFFSPAGWASVRWSESFFKSTLPAFVTGNRLAPDGAVWLPHVRHVDEMFEKFSTELSEHYQWELVNAPTRNPLYLATDKVTAELLKTPDFMTNESQIKPLLDKPFYQLKRKPAVARACPQMSPMAKRCNVQPAYASKKSLAKAGLKSTVPVRIMPPRLTKTNRKPI